MIKKLPSIILLICVSVSAAYGTNLVYTGRAKTKVFYSRNDIKGWKARVKGKIISFSVNSNISKDDLHQQVRSKSRVTVRLSDHLAIKVGDELFVIDQRHLIVARIRVEKLLKSSSMGFLLTGTGNFRNCRVNYLVVQRVADEYSQYARVLKGRGDYYVEQGKTGRAIAEYKKALKLDRNNPEAHIGLGYIYLKQGVLQFAFREFIEAYKNMGRLYDNEDRYLLLKGMTEIRFRETYYSYLPAKKRKKMRKEGIRYGLEALKVYPGSPEVNYYLGRFYYKKSTMPESEDKVAKNYFLTVLENDPVHTDANTALSELYFKYKNQEKARFYAMQALKGDPRHRRAKQILKYLDTHNKQK